MPRYHALDTAIQLFAWDPHAKANETYKASADLGASASSKYNVPSRPKVKETYGPAFGCVLDELKENYFDGHEAVDFLDHGMPFYLVKAGSDLFVSAEKEETRGSSFGPEDLTLTGTPSRSPANDTTDTGTSSRSSSLPSVDPEFFTSNGDPFSIPNQGHPGEHQATAENANSSHNPFESNQQSRNTIPSQKPIAIRVDLSQRSFFPSVNTNLRQELCITIFYNGELTHSRILRPNTFSSVLGPVGDEKYQYYSGRRIDSWVEVPWVIDTRAAMAGTGNLGFEDRWNKINKTLLAEADEWGQYGMFRSPMGEYLKELSKRPAPNLAENKQLRGARAGIIDVVITLGRTVSAAVSGLRAPRRKLHEDRCGKDRKLVAVPKELGPKKRASIVAQFNLESAQNSAPHFLNKVQKSKIGSKASEPSRRKSKTDEKALERNGDQEPEYTVAHNSRSRTKPRSSSFSDRRLEETSPDPFPPVDRGRSRQPRASRPLNEVDRQEPIKTPERSRRRASSLPMSSPFSCQRLNLPQNLPQKRYKGSYAQDDPPPKRRKLENELKALGCFSLDEPASSVRSKRAASSPATPRYLPDIFLSENNGNRKLRQNQDANEFEQPLAWVHKTNSNRGEATAGGSITGEVDPMQSERPQSGRFFGMDGNVDEPGYSARPRSSTSSSRRRPSLAKSEIQSIAETPATSTNLSSQKVSNDPRTLQSATRIVFQVRTREVATASVSRQKFEALGIQPSVEDVNTTARRNIAGKIGVGLKAAEPPFVQTNKFVTANHTPQQAKRTKVGVAASSQNVSPNVAVDTTPITIKKSARRKSAPPPQGNVPFSEGEMIDGSSESDTRNELQRGKPSLPKAKIEGGRKPVTHLPNAVVLGLKSLPALSETTSDAAMVEDSSIKRSKRVSKPTSKASPKTEPKSEKNSKSSAEQIHSTPAKSEKNIALRKPTTTSSSQKKDATVSEGSETPDKLPKSQPKRKRNSVSSRELKEVLTPHKGSKAVDASFGPPFKVQANEAPKRSRPIRKAKPVSAGSEAEEGASTKESVVTSGEIPISETSETPKRSRKSLAASTILPGPSNAARKIAKPRARKAQVVSNPSQNFHGGQKFHDSKGSKDKAYEDTVVLQSAQNHLPQLPNSGRPHRSYSVDSQGKKMPSPRLGSLIASSPLSQIQSHAELPETPTAAPQRKLPDGYSTKRLPTSPAPQIGEFSTASKPSIPAPPEMSISETLTFVAPTPLASSFAHIKAPAQAGMKKAADDNPSRYWKPTSLCDNSVLTYASALSGALPATEVDQGSNHVCRRVKAEREGVFRASGVLMGVRFVVGL